MPKESKSVEMPHPVGSNALIFITIQALSRMYSRTGRFYNVDAEP